MKTVIITGGASGLGLALARVFYEHDFNVCILDINSLALNVCKKEFAAKRILAIKCDITHEKDCIQAIKKIKNKFQHIDVLINNAGVSHRSLFVETKPEVIRRTMSINFCGSLNITHAAIADLILNRGSIIGISSVAGIGPLLGRTGYCASKYAMRGFFDTLREELKDKIKITMVYPSFIKTGLEQNASDGSGRKLTGSKRNNIGQEMTAEYAASKIYKAYLKNKKQYYLSFTALISSYLVRFFPGLYLYFMHKKIRSEFKADLAN